MADVEFERNKRILGGLKQLRNLSLLLQLVKTAVNYLKTFSKFFDVYEDFPLENNRVIC